MKPLRKFFSSVFFCILSFCAFRQMEAHAGVYQTIEAEIPVSCLQLEDDKTHVYEIAIESENNISPVPKSDVLEITEDGNGKFQIDIDEPGTFTYKVYERAGINPRIKYDSTVYYVTVYVEDAQNDKLTYAVVVTVNDSGRKPDKLEFQDIVLGTEESITTTVMTTTDISHTSASVTVVSSDTPYTNRTSSAAETTRMTIVSETKIERPPSVINRIQNFLNPLTGDNAPIGMLSGILVLCAVMSGISLSLKKQDEEGGQDNEDEDENQR